MANFELLRVKFNEAEVEAFLNDPDGPVAHLMRELGQEVAVRARSVVRKKTKPDVSKSGRPGTSSAPGATAASIEARLHAQGFRTPWSEISAGAAAFFLEHGTKPHHIESYGPWSLSNYGTGYFGYSVSHPGARPYPFLTTALWSLQGQV